LMFATPSTNGSYAGERVIALDPATGLLTLSNEVDSNWSRDKAFDVGAVTSTGLDSMLIGTATLYTPYFTAYDFASNTKSWVSGDVVGDGVAVTHAKLSGSSVEDIVGITNQGYIYAWDVVNQTLLWSSTQLAGATDIAAVDLDGDGVPEIIALAQAGVFVYKYSTTSKTYLQTHNYVVTGTNLLVADTDGDGTPEIFVLDAANPVGQGTGAIVELSSSLQLLNTYTVAGASSLYLEQSTFPRKNLVVAVSNLSLIYEQAAKIAVVDPATGTMIWESPFVSGSVPNHSLSFHDWIGSGQLQMAFGTSAGMYVTR
jgi:hypothetical protein